MDILDEDCDTDCDMESDGECSRIFHSDCASKDEAGRNQLERAATSFQAIGNDQPAEAEGEHSNWGIDQYND